MKFAMLIVLACTVLTVSACVVEAPYGRHAEYYRGDYGADYGRRVWRE